MKLGEQLFTLVTSQFLGFLQTVSYHLTEFVGCVLQISGLDVGWGQRIDLDYDLSENKWVTQRNLPAGRFPFKFIMDDRWTYSADHPTFMVGPLYTFLSPLESLDYQRQIYLLSPLSLRMLYSCGVNAHVSVHVRLSICSCMFPSVCMSILCACPGSGHSSNHLCALTSACLPVSLWPLSLLPESTSGGN
jgi:hypothetical protein